MTVMTPERTLFRRAVSQFATGVTVVTTVNEDSSPVGCTVNAFCSVSEHPPLVLVCIGRQRALHRPLAVGPGYAVNILAAHQAPVARRFSEPSLDRFHGLPVRVGRHGIPLLTEAVARIECDRHAVLDGGDHAIVLGLVTAVEIAEGDALLYLRGEFPEGFGDGLENGGVRSAPW